MLNHLPAMTEVEARKAGLFVIEEISLPAAQAAFAKLAKRAAGKLRCPAPTLSLVATGKAERTWIVDNGDREITRSRMVPAVFARIDGDKPKLAGWSLGARLERLANGERMVSAVPGVAVPERFRHTGEECEHCNAARMRRDVFAVFHESGEWKQIGRNCLKDFLGHDPRQLLAAFSMTSFVGEAFERELGGMWQAPVHFAPEVLAYTAAVIRLEGWMSRSSAKKIEEQGGYATPTSQYVGECYQRGPHAQAARHKYAPTPADTELAEKALAWVRAQTVSREDSDYMFNLCVSLKTDELDARSFGVACSSIAAYQRAMGKAAEQSNRAELNAASQFMGKEKERLRDLPVRIELVRFIESDFGGSTLVKMRHGSNVLSWFASGARQELEAGREATLTGTVKRHTEYKGTKETQLSRCAITLKAI